MTGALTARFAEVPQHVAAGVMAFGSGVLISTLAFELVEEAHRRDGLPSAAVSFLADPMTPEAIETKHDYTGLIAIVGFLASFGLAIIGGWAPRLSTVRAAA